MLLVNFVYGKKPAIVFEGSYGEIKDEITKRDLEEGKGYFYTRDDYIEKILMDEYDYFRILDNHIELNDIMNNVVSKEMMNCGIKFWKFMAKYNHKHITDEIINQFKEEYLDIKT